MNQTYSGQGSYSFLGIGVIMAALALFPLAGMAHADDDKNHGSKSGSGVEINIGGNGNVLVRGAKVTSVSSSTISANTNYGSSILGWTVKTNGDTEFSANKGSSAGISQIAVGDTISFRGSLDQAISGLTVNAKVVKDWTQAESKKTYRGMVTSINATLNSFTLSGDNTTTTVQTNSATKFKLSNGTTGSFADIFLNAKVKVMGMWSASSSVLTATSVDVGTTTKKDSWDTDDKKEWRNWIRSKVWLNLND